MFYNKFFTQSLLAVTVFIFWLGCKSRQPLTHEEANYRAIYIDQFKLTYFRQVLLKSYNNSPAIREIISLDHSGYSEPILSIEDHKLIDSLSSAFNQKLVSDSTDGVNRAEGSQGKRPLGFIMETLNSKWLDSLARARYKTSGRLGIWDNN